jgi:hypothetical protein
MSVYVDKARNRYGRMFMSHMIADTVEELHAMAVMVGLKRSWFQVHSSPHYDLCQEKRALAIRLGAFEVDRRQLVDLIRKRRPV